MRRQDQIPVQTNIISQVAVRGHFASRHASKSLAIIRVPEQYHGVDEIRLSSSYHFCSIVRYLCTLTVATDNQLRLGTLCHRLGNQLCHVLTPSRRATSFEPSYVGWVVVDALDGHLGGAKDVIQGGDEGRADQVADIPLFGRSSCENEGQVLACAIDEVIPCGSRELYVGAADGNIRCWDAGETTGRRVSDAIASVGDDTWFKDAEMRKGWYLEGKRRETE